MDVFLGLVMFLMRSIRACKIRIGVLGCLTLIIFMLPKVPCLYPYKDILSLSLIGMYFPFFVFGYIINHIDGVKNITVKVHNWHNFLLPLALIGIYGVINRENHAVYVVWPTMIASSYVVYQMVKDKSGEFTKCHFLAFVGQKSLYIYVFHYFFLPESLSYLRPYIQGNLPLELIVIFGYSVAIIFLALIVECFIKQSSFVHKLLFGK